MTSSIKNKQEIERLQEAFDQTLRLISLYTKLQFSIPPSLKGNLGEFIVSMELLRKFPAHQIDFIGGTFPRIDITIDKTVKIQVKTQFKQPTKVYKRTHGQYNFESSPTIKRSTIEEETSDLIILVILYFNEDYSKTTNRNIYIFNKDDFKFFSHIFCWSGKSKQDYTIVNILDVKGTLPPKASEVVNFYNTPVYKKLFADSKDNWKKIQDYLSVERAR